MMQKLLKFVAIFYNLFLKKEVGSIYKISSFLTELMYRDNIIGKDKMDSCAYGIQITIANIINFIIAFGIGILSKSLAEMAMFYVIFVSLRFFCGGYHAKSYARCFSLFALTCLVYVAVLHGIWEYAGNLFWLLSMAIIFLGICIWIKAPIEHINRPFTSEERKLFRKRSIQLFLAWSIVGIILWVGKLEHLSVGVACVFAIIAGYMLAERGEKDEEENA